MHDEGKITRGQRFPLAFFLSCVVTWMWATSVFRLSELGTTNHDDALALTLFMTGTVFWITMAIVNTRERASAVFEAQCTHMATYIILACLGSIGEYFAHFAPTQFGAANIAITIMGITLATSAFALATLLLWTSYRQQHLEHPVTFLALTFIAACVVLATLLPLANIPVQVAFPPLAFALLWRLHKSSTGSPLKSPDDYVFHPANKNGASDFFIGFSFGLFVLVCNLDFFTEHAVALMLIAAGIGISLNVLTSKIQQDNPNIANFQIGIPIISASWLLLCLPIPIEIAFVFQFTGLLYSLFVNQTLLIVITNEFSIPPAPVIYNYSYLILGMSLGVTLAQCMGPSVSLMPPVMIFALLLACTLLVRDRKLKFGWVTMNVDPMDVSRDFFRYACTLIGQERNLTPREQEVMQHLASGQNRSSISRDLFISEETVKSHTKNIYRKTDVHSRQELIDLVTAKATSLMQE